MVRDKGELKVVQWIISLESGAISIMSQPYGPFIT